MGEVDLSVGRPAFAYAALDLVLRWRTFKKILAMRLFTALDGPLLSGATGKMPPWLRSGWSVVSYSYFLREMTGNKRQQQLFVYADLGTRKLNKRHSAYKISS